MAEPRACLPRHRAAKTVAAARHAVAIDERRRTFPPTLWDNLEALNAATAGRPYAQHWFPGDHGSVGGGRAVTALSDDALAWVADGAAAAGLALDPEASPPGVAGRDWRGPLGARGARALLRRVLALDSRDREGPARVADLARAAIRRWQADPATVRAPLRASRAASGARGRRGESTPPRSHPREPGSAARSTRSDPRGGAPPCFPLISREDLPSAPGVGAHVAPCF